MKAKSGFVLREVGEGTVLVPTGERVVDMNGMVVLNDTGRFIWQQLGTATTPERIADALAEEYEVTPEDALTDVNEFIAELDRMRMLDHGDAPD
jgi:hypothetical protein